MELLRRKKLNVFLTPDVKFWNSGSAQLLQSCLVLFIQHMHFPERQRCSSDPPVFWSRFKGAVMTSFRHHKFPLAFESPGAEGKGSLGESRQPLVTALKPISGPVPSVVPVTHEIKASLLVSIMQIYTLSLCWAFRRVPDFPGVCKCLSKEVEDSPKSFRIS